VSQNLAAGQDAGTDAAHGAAIGAVIPSAVRRAVILAAGMGERLLPFTAKTPKCLAKVGGEPILVRALRVLAAQGFIEVVIVVGHEADEIRRCVGTEHFGLDIHYVDAPRYENTNNICSLWDARDFCDEDILLIEGDVVFDEDVVAALLRQRGSAVAVSPNHREVSGTVVRSAPDGRVTEFILGAQQGEGFDADCTFKTVNIYLLRGELLRSLFVPELCRQVERGHVDDYYESVLRDLVGGGSIRDLVAVDVSASRWCEVDDHRDLEAAEFLFLDRDAQFERIKSLHGSYWRYGFVDHCYLYNLHFPTVEMLDDLHRDLSEIVTHYPVGQHELARLVANWSGADPDHLVVANGGSELIKILGDHFVERMTMPVPSFNEYENTLAPGQLNRFALDPVTFELDVEAFGDSVLHSGSNVALIVSPNNPTALSVGRDDVLRLARRLEPRGCRLIVDESFIEFSRGGPAASVESVVAAHPNLVVLKSMSKVLGIAGLRIGYLLSADRQFVEQFRARLPIWNVNGLAEAFLRSLGGYRREFTQSCELVRRTSQNLYEQLRTVPGIEPIEPDANFVFCQITAPHVTARQLARDIYVGHNILIKDCASKSLTDADRYLRIASRTPAENRLLVEALADSQLAQG
jgi:histidinol-phosphate/aromatic aminotransferase/cobyric acid decarboxylase-like protein/CTP:phosphocholine cytidylyltransferase-like protein